MSEDRGGSRPERASAATRFESSIGAGGPGEVYRVHDGHLGATRARGHSRLECSDQGRGAGDLGGRCQDLAV
jgi:hypothetical protein